MWCFINCIVIYGHAANEKREKWGAGLGKPILQQAQGDKAVSQLRLKAVGVGKCESCRALRLRGRVAGGGECAIH